MFYGQTEKLISSIFHIYLRPEIKLSFLGLQIGHSLGGWELVGRLVEPLIYIVTLTLPFITGTM